VKITAPDFVTRLQLATEQDTAKGMFFNGVLSAAEKLLPPPGRAMCLEASGEKRFIDFLNYPIASFLHLSFTAAELLAPKVGGIPNAFRKLGSQALTDFLSSGVGKTLLVLVSDPERILAAVPTAFRTAVGYGERTVEFRGKGRCVITMKRDFMPHPYHEGLLHAAVAAMGGQNVKVVGSALGQLDTQYEITWDPKAS
jgi:uncharacterized protein (TIGR02265 family)